MLMHAFLESNKSVHDGEFSIEYVACMHYYQILQSTVLIQYSTWVGTSFRDDKQKVGVSDKIRFFSSIYHYLSPLFTFFFSWFEPKICLVFLFLPGLDFLFIASSSIVFTPPFLVPLREDCPVVQNRVQLLLKSNECQQKQSQCSPAHEIIAYIRCQHFQ